MSDREVEIASERKMKKSQIDGSKLPRSRRAEEWHKTNASSVPILTAIAI